MKLTVQHCLPPPTCDYDYTEEHEVPLVNVKKHVLAKVLDYCKHHVHNPPKDIQKVSGTHTQLRTPPFTCKRHPPSQKPAVSLLVAQLTCTVLLFVLLCCFILCQPLKTANLAEIVSAWDAAYVNVQQEMLFDLILAANYMDIKPLLDLTCAKVASMIKGKTPEEIRKTFNIENDFTPEEEASVREENKWCEET